MIELLLAASATALATGLGAIPVFFLGEHARTLEPALLGMAAGVMTTASVAGLLAPALDQGTPVEVLAGVAAGVLFLALARGRLDRAESGEEDGVAAWRSTSILVFAVLFVHSLPEGFAIGTAYASGIGGLSLFVIVAIGLQNIPEGTSVAIPMAEAGYGRARQFWAAVATSAPQPVGAAIAYLLVEEVEALLAVSFGFAAGAMLALVAVELVPRSFAANWRSALAGAVGGSVVMLALSAALGV
jgi:zinc transporter, ZIP family